MKQKVFAPFRGDSEKSLYICIVFRKRHNILVAQSLLELAPRYSKKSKHPISGEFTFLAWVIP